MKKYLYIMKTTMKDSLKYTSTLLFGFIGFSIVLITLICLWNYLYSDGTSTINGYTLNQMIWYLLFAEIISFGSGSKVATDEVRNCIKSGNIAYQINKPYNYITYTICKFMADTSIKFILFVIVTCGLGLIFAGPIENFKLISLLAAIPVFTLAVLIMGLMKILISISAFWVEDSRPFQNVYNKLILMFGVFFPLEMFSKVIQSIIKCTPIYGVAYGPAKLMIGYSNELFISVLISQSVTILVAIILISIFYKKGVKKLNVNGG